MGRAIPVVLVAGALGSGKTTLLRRLLEAAHGAGLRPSLLINEFGALDVDAALLSDLAEIDVYELTAGCICCTGQRGLHNALREVILHRPDVALVETSGLADPIATLDGLTMPEFLDDIVVTTIVTVADAARRFDPDRDPPALERQLALADLVVINKTDLASERQLAQLREQVRRWNGRARVIEAVRAELPDDVLAACWQIPASGVRRAELPVAHEHPPVHSVAVQLEGTLDRAAFEGWLRELPPSIWRAKGFVRFAGDERLHVFQVATGVRAITAVRLEPPSDAVAILIGDDLDEGAIREALVACRAEIGV
jgi:G3E family GTPase